jgi:hypothetical protein
MWHAALSLIVSTWATKRAAEIERNRFLAVDTVGMNRGQDGSPVPDPIAQAVIATVRGSPPAGRSLRQCAEMVREHHGIEVLHMTVKHDRQACAEIAGSRGNGRLNGRQWPARPNRGTGLI